jgi:hypothetical protein
MTYSHPMICKGVINSDTNSEDKELYLVSEVTRYNKIAVFYA